MKKEKYLQIFNYLLEFSKLRSNRVRDIENSETLYPNIIWFADIPNNPLFDCITFPNFNKESDYWIRINKPKQEPQKPEFPSLPTLLNDWIEKGSLTDENNIPQLKSEILKNGKTLLLLDSPQIEKEFQDYLNNKWTDDLELYKAEYEDYEIKLKEFEKFSIIYQNFFTIFNKAQRFGEEFELIVALGLLNFKENENTPLICRHILTSKVEITFEFSNRQSVIKVLPTIENDIQIETDAIIDLSVQFESGNIIESEKRVVEFLKENNLSDNIFDKQIKDALQIFSSRLRSDGNFIDELDKPKKLSSKPTIYYSPSLILRKRNTRSFTALYEKIIKDISNGEEDINIPSINDLIGYSQESQTFIDEPIEIISNRFEDETIYFPKKFNDEQIEIIINAKKNSKVLVQGPPGTGNYRKFLLMERFSDKHIRFRGFLMKIFP